MFLKIEEPARILVLLPAYRMESTATVPLTVIGTVIL